MERMKERREQNMDSGEEVGCVNICGWRAQWSTVAPFKDNCQPPA